MGAQALFCGVSTHDEKVMDLGVIFGFKKRQKKTLLHFFWL